MGQRMMTDTDNYIAIAEEIVKGDWRSHNYWETDPGGLYPREMDDKIKKIVDQWKGKIDGSAETIYIPYGVTTVWDHALRNMSNLTELRFPSTLTVLRGNAMPNCTSLKYLRLPPNLSSIGQTCFSNNAVMEVYDFSWATKIPTLQNVNAFNNALTADTKIVVPDNLYSTWVAASNWSDSSIEPHIISKSDYLEGNYFNGKYDGIIVDIEMGYDFHGGGL